MLGSVIVVVSAYSKVGLFNVSGLKICGLKSLVKVCVVLQRPIPGRDLFRNLSMHNACHYYACHHFTRHYFTRRSAVRSPSSDAFTWALARASRDITVPIGTPWMSATSR